MFSPEEWTVIRTGLDIVSIQGKEQYSINIKLIEISLERYKRIKIQNEFGNASHLDVLSAEIDWP